MTKTLPRLDLSRPGGLTGWHAGVLAVQQALGFSGSVRSAYEAVDGELPEHHREFHANHLHFLPLTTLDARGRPWVSLLAPSGGRSDAGWVASPTYRELTVACEVAEADPLLVKASETEPFLVAGLGIELETRRRNKFAGEAVAMLDDRHLTMHIRIDEALGNCPKYHNTHTFAPVKATPCVELWQDDLEENARLPDRVIDMITSTDILFLGTSFEPRPEDAEWNPARLGCNHRGGPKGFLRVRLDGRTVVLPDYSGNRMMTSLGNIEVTHVAGVTIPSFATGDILYLTCKATNVVGDRARAIMPRITALTLLEVVGYRLVSASLPIRSPDVIQYSPYNPPVRYLVEEGKAAVAPITNVDLLLSSIHLHADDLATLTFTTSSPVAVVPGQHAVIDKNPLFGPRAYAHMARPGSERSVNDDGIRTWTVTRSTPTSLSLTVREQPRGRVTGSLLQLARSIRDQGRTELLDDARELGARFELVGVGGDFSPSSDRLLFIAAGIGVSPLLAVLADDHDRDVVLVWSVRDELDVALGLLREATGKRQSRLVVHLFHTGAAGAKPGGDWPFELHVAAGRIPVDFLTRPDLVEGREVMVCGTPAFEGIVVEALKGAGVPVEAIKRESFAY